MRFVFEIFKPDAILQARLRDGQEIKNPEIDLFHDRCLGLLYMLFRAGDY